jgi:hypothetical protein
MTNAADAELTPQVLANMLKDPNSQYTIDANSANVDIQNVSVPGASTDPRAFGEFVGGNVAAGTLLEDPVDPNATFAGGIGIDTGVCLCTNFLSDNEPTRPPGIPAQLKVGVQGPNNGFPINPPDVNHEGEVSLEIQDSAFQR